MNKGIGSLMGESGRTVSDMDSRIANLASSQGMAPAEQRMMLIQKTAADMGRNISDRDAQLFGMGEISFEEAMSRARPSMDRVSGERNLMQQEQMFFPSGDNEETSRLQMQLANLQKQLNEDGANGDLQAIIKTTAQMDAIRKKMADIQMEMARIKMINENPYSLPFDSDAKAAMTKFKKQNFAKGGEAFPDLTGDGQVTQADILKGRGVFAEGDEVSSNVLGQFSEELPLTNYIMSLSNPEQSELLRNLIGVSGVAVGSMESIPMLIKRLVSTGSLKSPEAQAEIKKSMDMQERKKMAEGDEVSRETNEIESALSDIESVAPEAQVIQQVMTMVMELVQSGASEEEIVAALRQMGLDDEDIQAVFQMLEEQMQSQQDPIQSELSQMM